MNTCRTCRWWRGTRLRHVLYPCMRFSERYQPTLDRSDALAYASAGAPPQDGAAFCQAIQDHPWPIGWFHTRSDFGCTAWEAREGSGS